MLKTLYLFVGRSGAGKTTLVNRVCEKLHLSAVKSYTDRKKRFPSEDGHIFISKEAFDELPDKLAYASFDGNRYCTTKKILDVCDCFVVEPKGIVDLKRSYTDRNIVVIGIYASQQDVEKRMRLRGDNEDTIQRRLELDSVEFGMMDELCDVVFVNRVFAKTVEDIVRYIRGKEANATLGMSKQELYDTYRASRDAYDTLVEKEMRWLQERFLAKDVLLKRLREEFGDSLNGDIVSTAIDAYIAVKESGGDAIMCCEEALETVKNM